MFFYTRLHLCCVSSSLSATNVRLVYVVLITHMQCACYSCYALSSLFLQLPLVRCCCCCCYQFCCCYYFYDLLLLQASKELLNVVDFAEHGLCVHTDSTARITADTDDLSVRTALISGLSTVCPTALTCNHNKRIRFQLYYCERLQHATRGRCGEPTRARYDAVCMRQL
jgi:hypothetical protein